MALNFAKCYFVVEIRIRCLSMGILISNNQKQEYQFLHSNSNVTLSKFHTKIENNNPDFKKNNY